MDLDDIDYDNLPEDPQQAFLVIERVIRQNLYDRIRNWGEGSPAVPYFDYINNVRAAADELGLSFLDQYENLGFPNASEEAFRNFISDVDRYLTRTRIAQGRRNRAYSVAFDAIAKKKIGHYLSQIRDVIDAADLDDRKKEALYARINALQTEIDRSRTRFEAFGAYVIEAAGILGEAGKRIEPLTDAIAKVFGIAKSHEDAIQSLPKPPDLKKLNPPDQKPREASPIDDDIPF